MATDTDDQILGLHLTRSVMLFPQTLKSLENTPKIEFFLAYL